MKDCFVITALQPNSTLKSSNSPYRFAGNLKLKKNCVFKSFSFLFFVVAITSKEVTAFLANNHNARNKDYQSDNSKGFIPRMASSRKNGIAKNVIFNKVDLPLGTVVEFVTDLEGNWEYFISLVERSSVIQFDKNKRKHHATHDRTALSFDETFSFSLSPNTMLVHGGDSPDKGPGDIRVVKALVQLKRKYPDRVFLVCGNRDMNKLRFMSELHDAEVNTSTDIYWDPKAPTLSEYRSRPTTNNNQSLADSISSAAVSKLKWMLEFTMGSQTAFETRRMELAILKDTITCRSDDNDDLPPPVSSTFATSNVTDEEVVQSFRDSVDPSSDDPWMLEYIRYGQLMLIIGDCLFVHGGIDEQCLGQVPGRTSSATTTIDLESWCIALNQFYADMIVEFENQPLWSIEKDQNCPTNRRTRGGELLINYGVPGGNGGATVVYKNHVVNGNWVRPDSATVQYLVNGRITRVFVGHQPSGDCPAVITVDGTNDNGEKEGGGGGGALTFFCCDTSYSNVKADKATNPANNRGKAVSNVFIRKTDTTVRGKLANDETHGYILKVVSRNASSQSSLPFSLVGRDLTDGSWVKSIVGDKVLVAKGEGYIVSSRKMNVDEVITQLKRL